MEVVTITRSDCALLAARFASHGNSQKRMLTALEEACAGDAFARMVVLRQMEKKIGVDLGMVSYHFEHRNDAETHALERAVMNYVAQWKGDDLWICLDRIREVRDIVEEGKLVGEPEG